MTANYCGKNNNNNKNLITQCVSDSKNAFYFLNAAMRHLAQRYEPTPVPSQSRQQGGRIALASSVECAAMKLASVTSTGRARATPNATRIACNEFDHYYYFLVANR